MFVGILGFCADEVVLRRVWFRNELTYGCRVGFFIEKYFIFVIFSRNFNFCNGNILGWGVMKILV